MKPERIAALRALAEKATPGPWYHVRRDDDSAMSQDLVATVPSMPDHEGYTWPDGGEKSVVGGNMAEKEIVAGTLVQRPLAIAHGAERWPEDAAFIAAARTALPEALDEIERLRAVIREAAAEIDRTPGGDQAISDSLRFALEGKTE